MLLRRNLLQSNQCLHLRCQEVYSSQASKHGSIAIFGPLLCAVSLKPQTVVSLSHLPVSVSRINHGSIETSGFATDHHQLR
jgi:hypothetical protein